MKTALALDLGTDTGYALGALIPGTRPHTVGTWKLGTAKEISEWGSLRMTRRCDPRITRFFKKLIEIQHDASPALVVFEDVLFASSTYQVQLWSSFRGAVWCAFGGSAIIECVPTGTLKKFATGAGNATKPMMENSLFRLYPEWKSAKLSDDAIDALWLWYWSETHLSQA
jgi:Holliday junction resolvasome RuvABC endonuclease subunit